MSDDRRNDDRRDDDANHWGGGDTDGERPDDGGRRRPDDSDRRHNSDPDRRTPEAGIDAAVAPWEAEPDPGGTGGAVVEVVLAVVASFVLAFALAIGGGLVMLLAGYGVTSIPVLIVSLVGTQVGLAAGALAYLRWRSEPLSSIGLAVPDVRGVVLVVVGTVATLVLAFAASIAVTQLGLPAAENSTAQSASDAPASLLLLVPIAIFVIGPCEELLFRGVVQRRLREVASAPFAIVVASALFASAHVVALAGNPAAVATTIGILFFPALVFGVLYEYTKNVVVTALVHGLYDAVLFTLLYVALTYAPESADGTKSALDALGTLDVPGTLDVLVALVPLVA